MGRQLQGELHIKIELGHVVQNGRGALSLALNEWLSRKAKKDLLLRDHVVVRTSNMTIVIVWQTTSKNCTGKRVPRAARFFLLIQPIKSLVCGVDLAIAVVSSLPCAHPARAFEILIYSFFC